MGGNPDGLRSLAKYSKLPIERIAYIADADEGTVRSIDRGVIFLMAFWSGDSVKAFARLTEILASLPLHDLELVVVDVDGSAPLYELLSSSARSPAQAKRPGSGTVKSSPHQDEG